MEISKKIIQIIILFALSSCNNDFEKQIGSNYFIRKDSGKNNVVVSFGESQLSEGIIGPTVLEVHWNDSFILAKSNPGLFFKNAKNESEFYIIKKRYLANERIRNYKLGPLTKHSYYIKLSELNLSESSMNHYYSKL